MDLPEMQITDAMRAAAEKMIAAYSREFYEEPSEKRPRGVSTYNDDRQEFRRAAFDANPKYIADVSQSGTDTEEEDKDSVKEARKGFNNALGEIVSRAEALLRIAHKLPAKFCAPEDANYYGDGLPPKNVEEKWKARAGTRSDIKRT